MQVNVSKRNRFPLKGNQVKWVADNKIIKLNTPNCNEGEAEAAVSHLLQFTSVKSYVKYYPCTIVEDEVFLGHDCYSENFLSEGEMDVTFYNLFDKYGYDILRMHYDDVRDRLYDITGVDFKSYIDNCLCIDAITFNEDRHFNNFSVIKSDTGFRFAPLYDFGMSCISDKVIAKPFNPNFVYQLEEARVTPVLIKYNDFINSIGDNSFFNI